MTKFGIEKKIQCPSKATSTGLILSQEMPVSAVNDALIPVKKAFFALRFRVCLEQFKQLYLANVLNHFLGLLTNGCKHYFVVDLVEETVGESGSRSSSSSRTR